MQSNETFTLSDLELSYAVEQGIAQVNPSAAAKYNGRFPDTTILAGKGGGGAQRGTREDDDAEGSFYPCSVSSKGHRNALITAHPLAQ